VLIFFIAGLPYLLCFEHVDNLGAYSIPSETGLLIPSGYINEANIIRRRRPMKRRIPKNIDEYIERHSSEDRRLLRHMRATIHKAAPEATEKISYGIPTFYLNGDLVHFAAFANHIGFYPTSSGIAAFKKQLDPFRSSKGAVQFPKDQRLPLTLVAKIVKFRLKENLNK
jgi:uncharacterized protein YdhG (YjbR/CyaY superfamily)